MHRILNEIQPRDTNDYFSRAKILKECGSFDLEDLSASVPNIDTSAEIKGIFLRKKVQKEGNAEET